MKVRDNVTENTPQEEIDETTEYRKELKEIREKGQQTAKTTEPPS